MELKTFSDYTAYSEAALISLKEKEAHFRMEASTLAAPSADFIQALQGFPTASGKVVTRATAIRINAFLTGVRTIAGDIAKMDLILRTKTAEGGRIRTAEALSNPLYSLLRYVPNPYQTSYQLRWWLVSQLIMAGNSYAQCIRDQKGDIIALHPLDAFHMVQKWDLTGKNPVLYFVYSDGQGNLKRFEQEDLWWTTNTNIENPFVGSSIILLAKEALSLLAACEETAGRTLGNGLGMAGFITAPPELQIDEKQAQNVVDRLRRDYSGSHNAGKTTFLPGGLKYEKMSFNAQESQLLESRKYDAETVVRLLGGAPLLAKMGMGSQTATYAATSAQLSDYFQTSLQPLCSSLEQSITKCLIKKEQWATVFAKHDERVIVRGSLREQAETKKIELESGQITPNEARLDVGYLDTIEGADWLALPANSAVFDPTTKEFFIPGQKAPAAADETPAEQKTDTGKETPAEQKTDAVSARLLSIANSLADRIIRKEAKGGVECIDAKFVAEVLNISQERAAEYCSQRKDGTVSESDARDLLVALVTNADTNRDSNGRFAPGSGSGSHDLLKTAAVHDQINKLYQKAGPSFMDKHDLTEHSFTVDANGQPSEITSSHDASKNSVTVHKDADGNTTDQAIIHSHPVSKDPKPSDGDIQVAKKTGIPNYELSRDQLWVANPDGTTAKVGDVEWKHGQLEIKWKG